MDTSLAPHLHRTRNAWALALSVICLFPALRLGAEPFDVPLRNPAFEDGTEVTPAPEGWSRYAGSGRPQRFAWVQRAEGDRALLLQDEDPNAELGIQQDIRVEPGPALAYEASVEVAAVAGQDPPENVFLQMRFLPSNEFVQRSLATRSTDRFEAKPLVGTAPEGTRTIRLYLYTHLGPTTQILLDNVRLRGDVPPPPEPVKAPPMKAPVYTTLKPLYRETSLAENGTPAAAIVTPDSPACRRAASDIQAAVQQRCGVRIPIVSDTAEQATLPFQQNLIVLGNRDTNALLSGLYDRYFTLLDLRYPGPGGYVLRSLHNPFGNGHNAILVGGSDDTGISRAAAAFSRILGQADAAGGSLTLGWLMDIQLGDGVTPPSDLRQFETWEASDGYGSVGYFGWNSLSKRMAMYYMTGDQTQVAEFLRLAFPDEQAIKDIEDIDGERIENKDEPLAGAYHYNQHMMILYWDLIEESPLFSDEQRLQITNSLARQLEHKDYAREGVFGLVGPASAVGSRHGQWAAISLLCLGRYFQTHYPSPLWEHCHNAATWAFGSLHEHAWVNGESDNLFWYSTGIAPIFTYLTLSGDRLPLENGVIANLLRGQEMLLSGEVGDRQLNSASLGFLHKAAYLTGDGRWIAYRERTRMDTDLFRLGQSYWPGADLPPTPPQDLCGTWSVMDVPAPMWRRRNSGIRHDQSFQFGSFRTHVDDQGDFILLDGLNGASRNPYHTFAILDLRLAGTTLLKGYLNQVLTKADGMVEPMVAMDAALLDHGVLGQAAYATGAVPGAAFCTWQRDIVQRLGRYALITDELTFRTDSRNMTVETLWETKGGRWLADKDAAILSAVPQGHDADWPRIEALDAECRVHPDTPGMLGYLGGVGVALLRAREPGAWIEMPFTLDNEISGTWFLDTVTFNDRGVVRILLDGTPIAADVSLFSETATETRIPLGEQRLAAGEHVLRLEVTGQAPGAARCYAAIGALTVKPAAEEASRERRIVYSLHPATLSTAAGNGIIRVTWNGSVENEGKRRFFNLLTTMPEDTLGPACLNLDNNAAALRLPAAALVATSGYEGVEAGILIAAADHIFGKEVQRAGPGHSLFRTNTPVSLDWDFTTATLQLNTTQDTTLSLAVDPASQATRNGENLPQPANGWLTLALPAGQHTLRGVRPANTPLAQLRKHLDGLVQQGLAQRHAQQTRAQAANALPEMPPLTATDLPPAGAPIVDMIRIGPDTDPQLALAAGNQVHLIAADGARQHSVTLAGQVRVLHWWREPQLLLVGCADENVVAVGLDGQVRWTFTSVMDPAVYRAAKTYWFKTAPGHEGIHGLAAGAFYEGAQQCFVGSACTLEILDTNGKLVQRLPVFWGPGKHLRFLDQEDGSRDLLIARWPNGTDRLSILNSRTRQLRHGFYGVPAGHSMVGGWSAQNRVDVIPVDLDGDGQHEVVSATNGRWNRVTVFDRAGRPIANAQFGPGDSPRYRSVMRDLLSVDLAANGKPAIVTATAEGLVVALDAACERLWSRRLPVAPALLAEAVAPGSDSAILVGCDDGTLVALDRNGDMLRTTTIDGRPVRAVRLDKGPSRRLAVGSSTGHLRLVTMP